MAARPAEFANEQLAGLSPEHKKQLVTTLRALETKLAKSPAPAPKKIAQPTEKLDTPRKARNSSAPQRRSPGIKEVERIQSAKRERQSSAPTVRSMWFTAQQPVDSEQKSKEVSRHLVSSDASGAESGAESGNDGALLVESLSPARDKQQASTIGRDSAPTLVSHVDTMSPVSDDDSDGGQQPSSGDDTGANCRRNRPATASMFSNPTVEAKDHDTARPATPEREDAVVPSFDDLEVPKTAVIRECSTDSVITHLEVKLLVFSSWTNSQNGSTEDVGLTEVQFFDRNDSQLALSPDNVIVGGVRTVENAKLVNGRTHTTNHRNMWKTEFASQQAEPCELLFLLPPDFTLAQITIWNYNRPNCESLGVRDAELGVNDTCVWRGTIKKASGSHNTEAGCTIDIDLETMLGFTPSEAPAPTASVTAPTATQGLPSHAPGAHPSQSAQGNHSGLGASSNAGEDGNDGNDGSAVVNSTDQVDDFFADASQKQPRSDAGLWLDAGPQKPLQPTAAKAKSSVSNPGVWTKLADKQASSKGSGATKDAAFSPSLWLSSDSRASNKAANKAPAASSDSKPIWLEKKKEEPAKVINAYDMHKYSWLGSNGANVPANRGFSPIDEVPQPGSPTHTEKTAGPRQSRSNTGRLHPSDAITAGNPSPRSSRRQLDPGALAGWNSGRRVPENQQSLRKSWDALEQIKRNRVGRIQQPLVNNQAIQQKVAPPTNSLRESLETEDEISTPHLSNSFEIPTLPRGRVLQLKILSSWGDSYYVGLTGIELYTADGVEIYEYESVHTNLVSTNKSGGKDELPNPQPASNLFDGVNRTCNEVNMWLTPFTPNSEQTITFKLRENIVLASMRLWNYNSSRIHTYRGAKHVIISLDGKKVFDGEIGKAPGHVKHCEGGYGELILFTSDNGTLEKVAKVDRTLKDELASAEPAVDLGPEMEERPQTAGKLKAVKEQTKPSMGVTSTSPTATFTGRVLRLDFLGTWGDQYYLGLTGLTILDATLKPMELPR